MTVNRKLTMCKHCGAEIARYAVFCPHCGGKSKNLATSGFFFMIGQIVQSLIGLLKFLIGLAFLLIAFTIFLTYTGNWDKFWGNIQPAVATIENYIEGTSDYTKPSIDEEPIYTAESITDEDGVSVSFKSKMDSLEEFFDVYAKFMEKYNASDDTSSMLIDYTSLMTKYTNAMSELDSIDEDSLSEADYAYYTKVTLRITAVLINVASEID